MTRKSETISVTAKQPGIIKSLLLSLPMMLVLFVFLSGGRPSDGTGISVPFLTAFLFINGIFFMMMKTGRTDKWRAVLFITYAVCFVFSFVTNLILERGAMAVTDANMVEGLVPFCHIGIPMTLIPAALTKTIIFPGTIIGPRASVAGMFVLWIGASLALGRGFCGWFCFFGGLEDGTSRLFKKARIPKVNPKWRYLPFAVLFLIALMSSLTFSPFYCKWLCPFKTVTEYVEITSIKTAVQATIFISLFIALVLVLPAMTKRRIQCSLFCPMGAFQTFTNKLNVFDIRIDTEKCINCRKCISVCPTFSLSTQTIETGKPAMTCIKCGACVDICPQSAVSFHIKGTPLTTKNKHTARLLFLYPAFIFLALMSGGYLQDALAKIINLTATGSTI